MKKYLVLSKIGDCQARVVREFDTLEQAQQFCKLMQESEDYEKCNYYVAKLA